MGQHHTLGVARGAGGVTHQCHVIETAPGQFIVVETGMRLLMRPPLLDDLIVVDQPFVVVELQPAGIVVDDPLHGGNLLAHFVEFVDLFFILGENDFYLRMGQYVPHLLGDGILVSRGRNAPQGLGGQNGPVQARTVVADHGEPVSPPKPQLRQAVGQPLYFGLVLRPGKCLPDPELLLADRVFFGVPDCVALQQPGQGIYGIDHGCHW